MKKRYTLILMLAVAIVTTSLVAQNRRDRRKGITDKPPATAECYEQAGVTQETLDTIDELRKLAVEQLKTAETLKESKAIIKKLREDIKALFTEEQLAAIKDCMQQDKPLSCMDQIELTPEQIEAIDGIRAAAMEAVKEAETGLEVRNIIEQMHQEVEGVLTEEQLDDLRACRQADEPVNCMDTIGLSAYQIEQIESIRKAAIEAAKQAETRDEIRAIMDKMAEDTMAVLTPEQVEALNECRDAKSENDD